MNLCRYACCPTPEVPLSLAKRRYHPECALEVIKIRWRDRDRSDPTKPMRRYDNTNRKEVDMDSPEAIAAVEKAYQDALKAIRARPRGEPVVRYNSTLHGLRGTGL